MLSALPVASTFVWVTAHSNSLILAVDLDMKFPRLKLFVVDASALEIAAAAAALGEYEFHCFSALSFSPLTCPPFQHTSALFLPSYS